MDLATSKVRSDALPRTPRIRIYAYSSLGLYESQLPEMKDYQSLFTYFSGQTGEQRVRDGIDFRLSVKAGQHPRKRIAEEINKLPFKIRYTHL